MTMLLYNGSGAGLMEAQGKAFKALESLDTVRSTTVAVEIQEYLDQYKLVSSTNLPLDSSIDGVALANKAWQNSGAILTGKLGTSVQSLLVQFCASDGLQVANDVGTALAYLIAQMTAQQEYVTAPTVGMSLSVGGSNVGDAVVMYTTKRGDGKELQNMLPETINVSVATPGSLPTLQFVSGQRAQNLLSQDWPMGSGINVSVAAAAAGALPTNGNFQNSAIANFPDGWLVNAGTIGTHILMTNPEVQTIAISGSPTGGGYSLKWHAPNGITYATPVIAWNASAGDIQTALQTIPGLGAVAVALTSGTTPNFTYSITFTGVAGDISQVSVLNYLTGGSSPTVTPGTTTSGWDMSYIGRSMVFASDGVTLPEVYCKLTGLAVSTVYFCHVRLRASAAIAAGAVRFDILTGIGGSTTFDDSNNSNFTSINGSAISTSGWTSFWFSFRLNSTQTLPVWLRMEFSPAITNTKQVAFDEVLIVAGTELYPSGPFVAVAQGATPTIATDTWQLTPTNDFAGLLQLWYNRTFDMANRRLLLPTAGTMLIPDTVVD